jgi:hypothetical protein
MMMPLLKAAVGIITFVMMKLLLQQDWVVLSKEEV